MSIAAYRLGCGICGAVLSAASEAALNDTHVDHLAGHLTDYCEDEVAAGRMVRVERDGETLYREVKPGAHESQEPTRRQG
jgi:hypothetical protein